MVETLDRPAAEVALNRWPRAVTRWLPAASVLGLTVGLIYAYGVPPRTIAVFCGYVLGAVVVPGTLLWRVFGPRAHTLAEEIAAGTMLGYALEVLGYLPARATGQPKLVLVAPGLTVAAFLAVPRLRRHWRAGTAPVPLAWSWLISGLTGLAIVVISVPFFRAHGLTWPGNATPYVDLPYHLAVAAEVAHHMPPVIPYVKGAPLDTHWFFHVDPAAVTNVTGIELQTLLYRLSPLPMIAAFVVLGAVLASRCSGRLWAGPAAAAAMLLLVAPAPWGWLTAPVPDSLLLTSPVWTAPSMALGPPLFTALLLALHAIFQSPRRPGTWLVAGVLLAVVIGAKATYLPLLTVGLVLAAAVSALRSRRPYWTGLIVLGAVLGYLLFAQLVFYGRASQGLRIEPLATVKAADVALRSHLIAAAPATPLLAALLGAAVLLLCNGAMWSGLARLKRRPGLLTDPMMLVLLGIGVAAFGGILLFGQPGQSQLYFLQSARPFLAIAAVWAIAATLPPGRPPVLSWIWAGAAGAAAVWAVRLITPQPTPLSHPPAAVLWPLLVLATIIALITTLGRRHLMPAAVLAGCCLAVLPVRVEQALTTTATRPPEIPRNAFNAARWLRAHSTPDDLVATDTHCRETIRSYCDTRHFWMSAYTERRVLVEGWDYTNRILTESRRYDPQRYHYRAPFWNPTLLTANDAVFQHPSAASVAVLRDRYHVRWLFTEHQVPGLSRYATLRHTSGKAAVYEI
jgi:hypothetical protein